MNSKIIGAIIGGVIGLLSGIDGIYGLFPLSFLARLGPIFLVYPLNYFILNVIDPLYIKIAI